LNQELVFQSPAVFSIMLKKIGGSISVSPQDMMELDPGDQIEITENPINREITYRLIEKDTEKRRARSRVESAHSIYCRKEDETIRVLRRQVADLSQALSRAMMYCETRQECGELSGSQVPRGWWEDWRKLISWSAEHYSTFKRSWEVEVRRSIRLMRERDEARKELAEIKAKEQTNTELGRKLQEVLATGDPEKIERFLAEEGRTQTEGGEQCQST
jgi:hypothetical protein